MAASANPAMTNLFVGNPTWELDEAMRKVSKEKCATEQSWLVGKGNGLANCVVSLHAKGAKAPSHKALGTVKMKKVAWQLSPRVIACTPVTTLA